MTCRPFILLFLLPLVVVAEDGLVDIIEEPTPPLPDILTIINLPETTLSFANPWTEDLICGRKITVTGVSESVLVNVIGADPGSVTSHPFAEVRTAPEITIGEGDAAKAALWYTVAIMTPDHDAGWEKPYLNYLVTDMQAILVTISGLDYLTLYGGVPQLAYEPPVPVFWEELVLIRIWSSTRPLDVQLSDYTDKDICGDRCNFNVADFVLAYATTDGGRPDLTDVTADTFLVSFDEAAAVEQHNRDEAFVCYNLWRLDLKNNLLLSERDMQHLLPVDIHLGFKTHDSFVGPLCGRAFMYTGDFTVVSWDNSLEIPARKLRNIPKVAIIPKDWDPEINIDTVLFTLMYVGQSGQFPNLGNAQEPYLHWMINNIRGFDVSTGDCIVPYLSAIPLSEPAQMNVLLYIQDGPKIINPATYSTTTDCPTQYRCHVRLADMAADHGLTLISGVSFIATPDPGSIADVQAVGLVQQAEVCDYIASFNKEGRILGTCLNKFHAWKIMARSEHDDHVMPTKIMEMCPDIGMDLSYEMENHMGADTAERGHEDKLDEKEVRAHLKEALMQKWEEQAQRSAKEQFAKLLDTHAMAFEEKNMQAIAMKAFMGRVYEWKDMVLERKVKDVMTGKMELDLNDGAPSSECMAEVAEYLQGIASAMHDEPLGDAGHAFDMFGWSTCAIHAKLYLLRSLESDWFDVDVMDWTMLKKIHTAPLTSLFFIEMCKAIGMVEKSSWGTRCTAESLYEKMHDHAWFADKHDELKECMDLLRKWEDNASWHE